MLERLASAVVGPLAHVVDWVVAGDVWFVTPVGLALVAAVVFDSATLDNHAQKPRQ